MVDEAQTTLEQFETENVTEGDEVEISYSSAYTPETADAKTVTGNVIMIEEGEYSIDALRVDPYDDDREVVRIQIDDTHSHATIQVFTSNHNTRRIGTHATHRHDVEIRKDSYKYEVRAKDDEADVEISADDEFHDDHDDAQQRADHMNEITDERPGPNQLRYFVVALSPEEVEQREQRREETREKFDELRAKGSDDDLEAPDDEDSDDVDRGEAVAADGGDDDVVENTESSDETPGVEASEGSEDVPRHPENPDTHNGHPISQDDYVTENRGGIAYDCPACEYSGTLYHPVRDRPTYHAERREICPTPDCNVELKQVDIDVALDDEDDDSDDDPEGGVGDPPFRPDGGDVVDGLISRADTVFCAECQRERVSCVHIDDEDDVDRGDGVMTDGGQISDHSLDSDEHLTPRSPVKELPQVGETRSKRLRDAGIETVRDVADTALEALRKPALIDDAKALRIKRIANGVAKNHRPIQSTGTESPDTPGNEDALRSDEVLSITEVKK